MKLFEVIEEMTMSGVVPQTDQKMQPYFDKINEYGEIVGHQGNKNILKFEYQGTVYYGISTPNSNDCISIASFTSTNNPNIWQLGFVHTLSKFKGKGDIFRLLWFIKDQEGKSFIDYGVQTDDGIRFVKALAKTKRFSIKWINTETNKKQPYDPNTDSIDNPPFRSRRDITPWKIFVECSGYSPAFPRFRESMLPNECLTENFFASINEIYDPFEDITYEF